MSTWAAWATDLTDLVLSRHCLQCEAPGRPWCDACTDAYPRLLVAESVARPPVPLFAAVHYAGAARTAIVDYKERGNRALAAALGDLLAEAVAVQARGFPAHVILVPVPGHRRPARGFDALGDVVRRAGRRLRAQSIGCQIVPAVGLARDGGPIKHLDRPARQAAVAGSMRSRGDRRIDRLRATAAPVVVVDDVVTTGATITAAIAALAAAGVRPTGVAAVARA